MRFLILFAIFLFLGLFVFLSCGEAKPERLGIEKIIAVEPHHATRVIVIFKDHNGLYYSESIHHSGSFSDGKVTINPSDYLSDKKHYGPLPNCDEDYKEYKKRIHNNGGG